MRQTAGSSDHSPFASSPSAAVLDASYVVFFPKNVPPLGVRQYDMRLREAWMYF